jgi:hypothetical protein
MIVFVGIISAIAGYLIGSFTSYRIGYADAETDARINDLRDLSGPENKKKEEAFDRVILGGSIER